MLVTYETEVKTLQERTAEVKLPYHSKDGQYYYRINNDESVLVIYSGGHSNITIYPKGSFCYKQNLADTLKAKPCEAEEMQNVLERITDQVGKALLESEWECPECHNTGIVEKVNDETGHEFQSHCDCEIGERMEEENRKKHAPFTAVKNY